MPPADAGSVHRGPRGLNRDLIVDAALDYIDNNGSQQLTMRALADVLGVEAMSLYRYIRGREDLLEAVVDRLLQGVTRGIDEDLSVHWQGYLQAVAHEVRRIAVEHPHAFPLVATRHPAAPWLRPPLRSLEVVDHFLSTLIDRGFSDHRAVEAYQYFSSFLLGQLLLESAVRGAATSPVEEPLDEGDADVPNDDGTADVRLSPTITRLRSELSTDNSQEQFEVSLERLLDQLDHDVSQ